MAFVTSVRSPVFFVVVSHKSIVFNDLNVMDLPFEARVTSVKPPFFETLGYSPFTFRKT